MPKVIADLPRLRAAAAGAGPRPVRVIVANTLVNPPLKRLLKAATRYAIENDDPTEWVRSWSIQYPKVESVVGIDGELYVQAHQDAYTVKFEAFSNEVGYGSREQHLQLLGPLDKFVLVAMSRGEPLHILRSSFINRVTDIRDYVVTGMLENAAQFRLWHQMSFDEMNEASQFWHTRSRERTIARETNMRREGIPQDPDGAPVVIELTEKWQGWKWVWLRGEQARRNEGIAMGHCVGSYNNLPDTERLFSLRDAKNVAHLTVHLATGVMGVDFAVKRASFSANVVSVRQARGIGNSEPKPEYKALVEAHKTELMRAALWPGSALTRGGKKVEFAA